MKKNYFSCKLENSHISFGGAVMLSKEKLDRINELSKKAKINSLTLKESKEQQKLRQEYIESFRSSFKNQLHSIKVVDEKGDDVTPSKLKKIQKAKQSPKH